MFHLAERLSTRSSGERRSPRKYLQRAGLFAAGLFLLWVALRLVPSVTNVPEPPVYSDDAGTVAASPESGAPPLISPGNIAALLLLAGGVAVAVYLRRRKADEAVHDAITTLGRTEIGQQQQLLLVRCVDEVLLLGVTASQISLLRTYDPASFDERATPTLADAENQMDAQQVQFAEVLRQSLGLSGLNGSSGSGRKNGAAR